MKINQMIFEITQRFALGPIIGKLIQITEPSVVILPVGVGEGFHENDFLTPKVMIQAANSASASFTLRISGAMVLSVKSKTRPLVWKSSGRGREPPRLSPWR